MSTSTARRSFSFERPTATATTTSPQQHRQPASVSHPRSDAGEAALPEPPSYHHSIASSLPQSQSHFLDLRQPDHDDHHSLSSSPPHHAPYLARQHPPSSPPPFEFGPPPPVHRILSNELPGTDLQYRSSDLWDDGHDLASARSPPALNAAAYPSGQPSSPTLPPPTYSSPSRSPSGAAVHVDRSRPPHARSIRTASSATPGMDNLGRHAPGGGINGLAMDVASHDERYGRSQMHGQDERYGGQMFGQDERYGGQMSGQDERYGGQMSGHDDRYGGQMSGHDDRYGRPEMSAQDERYGRPEMSAQDERYGGSQMSGHDDRYGRSEMADHDAYYRSQSHSPAGYPGGAPSYSSTTRLESAAAPIGMMSSQHHPSDISLPSYPPQSRLLPDDAPSYPSQPSAHHSSTWDPRLAQPSFGGFDPNDIDDDGDDGLGPQAPNRSSMLSLGPSTRGMLAGSGAGTGAGAAAAGSKGGIRGLFGKKAASPQSGADGPDGQFGYLSGSNYNGPVGAADAAEKSEWLDRQRRRSKRMKRLISAVILILIILAIVGAIAGGVLGWRAKTSSGSGSGSGSSGSSTSPLATAAEDDGQGDLNKDSDEIKKLLGNKDLHKVFPGVDYTAWGTQYPDCLKWPPSQNNVTRDMAVLSQLTNKVRLYGTDCNQTEMVLHSIGALGLTDMKVWIGVWQDSNATDNARQLDTLYSLLDKHGADPFAGIIVGNEVLFRKDMTEDQLASVIQGVRSNLTAKGIKLPVATSDLGDNWTAQLASEVDIVMANVHPFFAGVTADQAAGWTYDFWTTHDVALTTDIANKPQSVISEVGWPSEGGNDCGEGACTSSTDGSVAGISEMNTFMDTFVCQSLANGTNYFWFEAFDEPWKIRFDTPGKNWEDKWGLMDSGRNIKPGLKIPDCGGKVVS